MFTRKLAFAALCLGAVLTAATATVSANVVYSDYPATSFTAAEVMDLGSGSYQALAASFVPTANYTYTSATLALNNVNGSSANDYTISINSDSNSLPGTALDTASGVSLPNTGNLTVSASGPLTIVSGTTYWLVATPAANGDNGYWYASASYSRPWAYQQSSGGPWTLDTTGDTPAFEIDGTPNGNGTPPEPATLALLAFGGLILLARRRGKTLPAALPAKP